MVNPTLRQYVEDCVAQSCGVEEVRQTLLTSGWPEAEVAEALTDYGAPTPLVNNELIADPVGAPARPKRRRTGLIVGGVVAVLVVVIAVPTALAEQGYLPAFSRIYGKANLAVAWNGLPGKPSLALAKSVSALSSVASFSGKSSLTMQLSKGSSTADAATLNNLLAALKARNSDVSRNLASIPTDSASAAQDYTQYLPLSLAINTTAQSDQSHATAASATFDLTNILQKIPMIQQFVPTLTNTVTFESTIVPQTKTAYFKSNVLPYKNDADKGKWLAYVATDNIKQNDLSVQDATKSLSSSDLSDLGQVVDGLVKDLGVERVGGKPQAHYQAAVNLTALTALKKQYPNNKYLKDVDLTGIQQTGSINIDAWIGEFDHLIYRLKITTDSAIGQTGSIPALDLQLNSDTTLSYNTGAVAVPAADTVIQEDATKYIMEAYQSSAPTPSPY